MAFTVPDCSLNAAAIRFFFMSGPPRQAWEHLKMHFIRSIDDLEVFFIFFAFKPELLLHVLT